MSFAPEDPSNLFVTGKNVYKFFKISESMMRPIINGLAKKDKVRLNTTNYSTHIWVDKKILIMTDEGDIMISETSGEFKMMLPSAPQSNFSIRFAVPTPDNAGFLITSHWGKTYVYEKTESMKVPYQ